MQYPQEFNKAEESNLWLPNQQDLTFNYSDGSESEKYIETILREAKDLSSHSAELNTAIKDWPSEYHFSPKRSNLFRPLRLDRAKSVLELGSGCGAITRYLGETISEVIGIEGSAKRAEIAALRTRDLENVQIICGNYQDVEFSRKFDIVTIIGILEYSGKYIDSESPYLETLKIAKKHLKKDGILILAIENKLGLKYFAGCTEDHTRILFDGIEGYSSSPPINTFGKAELESLLKSADFSSTQFLYPFPDYKVPTTILNLDQVPSSQTSPFLYQWLDHGNSNDYNREKTEFFQEYLVTKQLETNGLLPQMSNSFLVVSGLSNKSVEHCIEPEYLAWKYNATRAKKFMTVVSLEKKGETLAIHREYLHPSLIETQKSPNDIVQHHLPTNEQFVDGILLIERFLKGIRSFAHSKNDSRVLDPLKTWYDFLVHSGQSLLNSTEMVPGHFLDCLPWNLMETSDHQLVYFDQEWSYKESLPIKFILFRGFLHLYRKVYPFLDANWTKALSDISFISFYQFCMNLLSLEVNQEELLAFEKKEWELQKNTILYFNLALEEFHHNLTSPSSLTIKGQLANVEKLNQTIYKLGETTSALSHEISVRELTITSMESSKFWKIRIYWQQMKKYYLGTVTQPPFSFFFSLAKKGIKSLQYRYKKDTKNYRKWRKKNASTSTKQLILAVEELNYKPLISVLVPVYNTPKIFLKEAIESVLSQGYPNWELCISDDASTLPHIRPLLEQFSFQDDRIKVSFRKENGHISKASNSALELVTGEFIALLDHDDLLSPDALYEMALCINKHPEVDMIYSDEDKINEYSQFVEPFFKPDWCPDSLLSRMYTCHLGVYRTSIVKEMGGFREGYEGSQDYDLVLRLTERTNHIFHIPKILYHWRVHKDSTASNLDNKEYTTETSIKALSSAIGRRNEPGSIILTPNGHFSVRYHIQEYDSVTIIIPTKNLGKTLNSCLTSIFEKTIYPNYKVLVIDNGSDESETLAILDEWKTKESKRFSCEKLDIPFNFSKINNYGVQQSNGKYLLFLNNDTEVLKHDWLNAMVEQAQRPSIGAVGAKLLYPDNTIQHAGVVGGIGGVAGHSHKHFDASDPGYFDQIQTINNYSAVTAACLMCRRNVFEEIGGFEENLQIAFNDIDLCFKIIEAGYHNIYLPHVVLYHYESKSRGYEDTPEKQNRFSKEVEYMKKRWPDLIKHDPCYSPHLTLEHEDYRIRI